MANKDRYTAETIIEALKATKGMVYVAADRLRCHPDTVKNYAKRYASVAAEIDHQDGIVDDMAELKLIQAIQNGEAWAIKYRLSTKGKKRGYAPNIEITGANGGPLETRDVSELSDEELGRIASRRSAGTT